MQKSQEARIRSLAHDLLTIVDRRDKQALKQAAALAAVPAKHPKRVQPTSFVREVALGNIILPPLDLAKASHREKVLAYRETMRAGDWTPDLGEAARFERDEINRFKAASEMLRRGVDAGAVAVKCDLTTSEVDDIREQLKM